MKLKEKFLQKMEYKNYSSATIESYWGWVVKFIKYNKLQEPEKLTDKINDTQKREVADLLSLNNSPTNNQPNIYRIAR